MTSDEPSLYLTGSSQEEYSNKPTFDFEENLYKAGYCNIAGTDEAGRGPLCGPVVAASVILDPVCIPPGIDDSKKLKAPARESLFEEIISKARDVGIGIVDEVKIDRINILRGALLAMERAVRDLKIPPGYILVDGNSKLSIDLPQLSIIKGDSRSLSIAAASIVAKVIRDRIMLKFSRIYPQFHLNKKL